MIWYAVHAKKSPSDDADTCTFLTISSQCWRSLLQIQAGGDMQAPVRSNLMQ